MMQGVKNLNVDPFAFTTDWPHIPIKPILDSVVDAIRQKTSFEVIAARFHKTLIELFTKTAIEARKQSNINIVVLSGGVFQNEILAKYLGLSLQNAGFKVYQNKQVPSNDGGISLGQVVIGQKLMTSGQKNVNFENFVL